MCPGMYHHPVCSPCTDNLAIALVYFQQHHGTMGQKGERLPSTTNTVCTSPDSFISDTIEVGTGLYCTYKCMFCVSSACCTKIVRNHAHFDRRYMYKVAALSA